MRIRVAFPTCLALCSAALGLVGCADPDSAVGFHEAGPEARVRAIRQAGNRDDKKAIPDLIELLQSDDPAERLLSIRTLEKMTGQTLGYDHTAGQEQRREAAKRWADWYSKNADKISAGT